MLEVNVNVNEDVDDAVNDDILNYVVRINVIVNIGEDDGDFFCVFCAKSRSVTNLSLVTLL